jgi:hypothetical protein
VSGQLHAPAALTPGKSPCYPFYRRLGEPQSRSGRYGEVKIFYPIGTRTPAPAPGRPACSQSLYQLRYPGSSCDEDMLEIGSDFSKFRWNLSKIRPLIVCLDMYSFEGRKLGWSRLYKSHQLPGVACLYYKILFYEYSRDVWKSCQHCADKCYFHRFRFSWPNSYKCRYISATLCMLDCDGKYRFGEHVIYHDFHKLALF